MTKPLRRTTRSFALRASAFLGTPRLFRPSGESCASALLFHRFFADGEDRKIAIERLRRQLDWLCQTHTPVSLPQFIHAFHSGSLPARAVLVTTDDGLLDLIDVVDEFKSFGVPLCAFVCAGWTAAASQGTGEDLVARTAAAIHWYEGPDLNVRLGHGGGFSLSAATKATSVDFLLSRREALLDGLEELCRQLERPGDRKRDCCTWDELQSLVAKGVSIGAHSVTHVWMSRASAVRRQFEIVESRRLCKRMLGQCDAFAYPYGMAETHNTETRDELLSAGFDTAFLTHSEFIAPSSDAMTLPRIAMPDDPMSQSEFRARASGAGIVMRRLKSALRSH